MCRPIDFSQPDSYVHLATIMEAHAPLIITLEADAHTFSIFDALRQQHFPPRRNVVPAHITLFHALPGAQEHTIIGTLADHCAVQPPMQLAFPGVRFLRRGVAAKVDSPALTRLRGQLANAWRAWLTPQDQQRYQPHLTIQNKVPPEQARALFQELDATWQAWEGTGTALMLWRYLGGPWAHVATFSFEAANQD